MPADILNYNDGTGSKQYKTAGHVVETLQTLLGDTATSTSAIGLLAAILAELDTAQYFQSTQPVSLASQPLPTGAATSAKQDSILTALAALATATKQDETTAALATLSSLVTTAQFQARIPTLGPKSSTGSVSITVSTDHDPILDHDTAVKFTANTTSQIAITTPSNCKFMRVHAADALFLRTDGGDAGDNSSSILILANVPEVIPVPANTAIKAAAVTGTSVLRITPYKVR